MTQNRSILPVQYLWFFAMIMLLTSYSKDTLEKEAKYWSLSQRVKGQPSCNPLVVLYFWRNIFTPLNHRCIQLQKKMVDDDWKTPRTSKDKKVIGQGQYRMLSDRALCLRHFLWILQALVLLTCSLLLKCDELSMFCNILFPFHRLFNMHSTWKVRYCASHAIPSNRPTEVSLHWTWFKVSNPTQ